MLHYSRLLYSTFLAGILALLYYCLKSSNYLTFVDFTTTTRYAIYNARMHQLEGNLSLTLLRIDRND